MSPEVDRLIDAALAEDIGSGDITTSAIYSGAEMADARIIAKESGIIAGLELAEWIYTKTDPLIRVVVVSQDGARVQPGDEVMRIHGSAHHLLMTERVVLNFMQRMSGIATKTRQFADLVAHTNAKVLDTRKTLPGHRELDKWAVRLGGGENHRIGLYDRYLIKENHISVAGGIAQAIRACAAHREKTQSLADIEIEVGTLAQLDEVLRFPDVAIVMLDNMSREDMSIAVTRVAGRMKVEASGNVSLDTIAPIAETGVDYISVGALTHSVRALDLSMLFG
jgi:nicotinate-nucleotide pyrophosphorylase (carboxylating)